MSNDNFDLFDDDVVKNLEKLKAKYSDYGVDDKAIETINKNIIRSDPKYNAFEADFAGGFSDTDSSSSELAEAKPAPVKKPIAKAPAAKKKAPASAKPTAAPKKASAPVSPAPAVPEADDIKEQPIQTFEDIDSGFSEFKDTEPTHKIDRIPDYREIEEVDDYTAEAELTEKTAQKAKGGKKKKKSHKLRNTLLIVFILAVIWGAFFAVDYVLISNWREPVFCIKTDEFKNGSVSYMGLFYKFQYHNDDNGNKESLCMPWFKAGPNDTLERKNEKASTVKTNAKVAGGVAETDNSTEVTVSIPEDYLGFLGDDFNRTAPELTSEQQQQGYKSVSVNSEDNSVSFTLGKADHLMAVETIKTKVIENLENLAANTEYPSIKKEEHNADDFSSVTLYVDKKVFESNFDRFVDQYVFENVGFYQSFAQLELKCSLVIKDEITGEEIKTFNIKK